MGPHAIEVLSRDSPDGMRLGRAPQPAVVWGLLEDTAPGIEDVVEYDRSAVEDGEELDVQEPDE